MAGAFASISVFAYFMGRIWPWGIIMAVVPLVIGKRSSVEEEYFRETKETGEAPPVAFRREVKGADLEPVLRRFASATTSGFGVDKVQSVLDTARRLGEREEKKFQYVVLFAGRPTSLQLIVRRLTSEDFELVGLSDPALIENLKNA